MSRQFLTEQEMKLMVVLKEEHVLVPIDLEERRMQAKNGGQAIFCGDGDIDTRIEHARFIHRPHRITLFGGPLILATSFRGIPFFFRWLWIRLILLNLQWGREAKEADGIFIYPHWPCGVGVKFNYSMWEVLLLMLQVEKVCSRISKNIIFYFHVKKQISGFGIKQNTYKLDIWRLADYASRLKNKSPDLSNVKLPVHSEKEGQTEHLHDQTPITVT